MKDIIILLVVAVILVLAGLYIYKAKKNGRKCIGCPDGKNCSGKCESCACSYITDEE